MKSGVLSLLREEVKYVILFWMWCCNYPSYNSSSTGAIGISTEWVDWPPLCFWSPVQLCWSAFLLSIRGRKSAPVLLSVFLLCIKIWGEKRVQASWWWCTTSTSRSISRRLQSSLHKVSQQRTWHPEDFPHWIPPHPFISARLGRDPPTQISQISMTETELNPKSFLSTRSSSTRLRCHLSRCWWTWKAGGEQSGGRKRRKGKTRKAPRIKKNSLLGGRKFGTRDWAEGM